MGVAVKGGGATKEGSPTGDLWKCTEVMPVGLSLRCCTLHSAIDVSGAYANLHQWKIWPIVVNICVAAESYKVAGKGGKWKCCSLGL